MAWRTTLSRALSVCAAILLSLAPLPSDAYAFHREDRDHVST